jgi:hypothetical protein
MVFCKAPEVGAVKTRLAGYFDELGFNGLQVAAKIHEHLALHCLKNYTKETIVPIQLWCSPDIAHPFFQQCEATFDVELKAQGQGDLGERMSRSFDETLSGNGRAVVVGTDCPALDGAVLGQAFSQLHQGEGSVIGPTEDGGYALLGLSEHQPDIFSEISWGSSRVCEETLKKLRGRVQALPQLWDVDRPDDVKRLLREAEALHLDDEFRDFLESIV